MRAVKITTSILAVLVVLGLCEAVWAGQLHVPSEYGTIQAAINAAAPGDTVIVAQGTYTGSGNRDLDFGGKAITVRSTDPNDPAVVAATIIDCENSYGHRGFYFHSGEDANSIVCGLTIKRGRIIGDLGDLKGGGGIYCSASSPTIKNCAIIDNMAAGSTGIPAYGGGIYCVSESDPAIINCTISNNKARGGNGAWVLLRAEGGDAYGGGIYGPSGCNLTIQNCLIADNECQGGDGADGIGFPGANAGHALGGGIFCISPTTISNCTIINNKATAGSGGSGDPPGSPGTAEGGGIQGKATTTITNCIIWGNGDDLLDCSATYSCIEDNDPGTGNIHDNPLFVGTPMGDYCLSQIAAGQASDSPCVDAGSDTASALGMDDMTTRTDRVTDSGTVDMGLHYLPIPYVYHVDGVDGNDANDGFSRQTAFATIQKGIDEAVDYDTVLVWPAVYNEYIDFLGKAITVQSADYPATIDAPTGYDAVTFHTGEGPNSILKNFVITDSDLAVSINYTSNPTITNLTIVDNDFGIACYDDSDPCITNCIFYNNSDGDLFRDPVPLEAQYSWVEEEVRVEEGLFAYWKFDEGGGAIAHDSVGSNDGTLVGDPCWTSGQIRGALSFDGVGDYVDLDAHISDYQNLSTGTISVWIKKESTGSAGGFFCASDGGDNYSSLYFAKLEDERIKIRISQNDTSKLYWISTDTLPTGWHHFAYVTNSSGHWIYLDGEPMTGSYTVGSPSTNAFFVHVTEQDTLRIGHIYRDNEAVFPWDGLIDDVRIYDEALSPEEIQQIYEYGLGPLFADAEGGDYHLLSERGRYWPEHNVWVLDEVSGPCIDGGDPAVNPSNERMPNGGRINMGAYGNTPYASMSEWPLEGDLNRDGKVNFVDFAKMGEDWLGKLDWVE